MVWNIFFLSPDEFRSRIANDEFLEYEEVYQDRFYGTLKAQVEKQLAAGQNVVFDVDVVGGCNIKKFYGERALSVFIQPPSVEELRKRLVGRGTDTPEVIESRIAKAEYELSFAPKFDAVIVNDDLETAKACCFEGDNSILEPMKQTRRRSLSPGANKFLLVLNIVLFLGAIVLAVLNIDLKEYIPAVAMFIVMLISGINIYGCWKRLKGQL